MASSFERTLRSLENAGGGGAWLAATGLLLAAWGAWMFAAELSVYASAPGARVEVLSVPSSVAAASAGRVAKLSVELGAAVRRGQVLLELEGSVQRAELDRQRAALGALDARRQGAQALLAAERGKQQARSRLAAAARERAGLALEHARERVAHERELAEIAAELHREQLGSRIDALQADGKLLATRLAADEAAAELARVVAEHGYQDRVDQAAAAELARKIVELDAERSGIEAAIAAAEAELSRLTILAPIDGKVGSCASLQLGDIVEAGQVVASIVPPGEVRVVAHYAPSSAVGRVLPGQPARMRLDGFSWLEYGALGAHVVRAANEPEAGSIRVELALADAERSDVPLQHGLTGTVDIRIDSASPWQLLERSVGSNVAELRAPRAGAGSGP